MAVRADGPPRFFVKAALVQSADRHVQDGLIGREGEPVGILARIGGQVYLALRIDAKHPGEAHFALRGWHTQLRVGEKDTSVGAADNIVRFVEALALPVLRYRRHRTRGVHACNTAMVGPFAHKKASLPVECAAVAFAGLLAYHHHRAVWIPA